MYQVEELEDYDSDEDIKGDDNEESSTLIPLDVTPVIMEFVDAFPQDLPNKVPLIRNI